MAQVSWNYWDHQQSPHRLRRVDVINLWKTIKTVMQTETQTETSLKNKPSVLSSKFDKLPISQINENLNKHKKMSDWLLNPVFQ